MHSHQGCELEKGEKRRKPTSRVRAPGFLGRVMRAVPLITTAASSANKLDTVLFSSGGSSITSRPACNQKNWHWSRMHRFKRRKRDSLLAESRRDLPAVFWPAPGRTWPSYLRFWSHLERGKLSRACIASFRHLSMILAWILFLTLRWLHYTPDESLISLQRDQNAPNRVESALCEQKRPATAQHTHTQSLLNLSTFTARVIID